MQVSELLIHFMERVHHGYMGVLEDLSDEQLMWRHNDDTVSIGFNAWHYFRTKDNIVNFVCQDRKTPVWLRQGLNEAWGFPKVEQGTGMERETAQGLRIPSTAALLAYARDVHDDVMPYLQNATEEELASTVRVVQFGHRAKSEQILQTSIVHGNGHLGQIHLIRTLIGLDPGQEI